MLKKLKQKLFAMFDPGDSLIPLRPDPAVNQIDPDLAYVVSPMPYMPLLHLKYGLYYDNNGGTKTLIDLFLDENHWDNVVPHNIAVSTIAENSNMWLVNRTGNLTTDDVEDRHIIHEVDPIVLGKCEYLQKKTFSGNMRFHEIEQYFWEIHRLKRNIWELAIKYERSDLDMETIHQMVERGQ